MRKYISVLACLCALFGCSQTVNSLANGNCSYNPATGFCECIGSPIVIDMGGDGIRLSSPEDGVQFALSPGHPRQWSWTVADGNDAWLVFDRNQNGIIDDGSEMFGDYTPQPSSSSPNGFAALAVYDTDHDGYITPGDSIWPLLRLWNDRNHDGISQNYELSTLGSGGIRAISVAPASSDLVDANGNEIRFSARVIADRPVAQQAYDVWLRSASTKMSPRIYNLTVSYKCWGWGYYRNSQNTDICSTPFVLTDPIATDGLGRLTRLVARWATRSTQEDAVFVATNTVQSAANIYLYGDGTCQPPVFPMPDSYRPPPYWSPYDPYVWVRASCDPPIDSGGGGGGGGECE